MKVPFLLLLAFLFNTSVFSQTNDNEPQCRDKCSHAHVDLRQPQLRYFQYPSMDNYDVKYLKIDLDVVAGSPFLSGTSLTVAKVVHTLDSFNIELKDNMIVDSVYINGVKKNFDRGTDYIFIPLSPALPVGATVSALFYYHGTAGNGVYEGVNSGGNLTFTATLSESYQAREWFPAKQILGDKIDSADIWIKTDAINKVGSNGKLVAIVDSPGNKKQYQWKSRHPMNYYMPSFAVGNYMEYRIYAKPTAFLPDSVLVLNYIVNNASYFNSVKATIDKTPAYIEKFSDLFGLYPFSDEKYGHAQATIGGGMEHQTMTTMSFFGSAIEAHELGHQWWGDHVTCASWNHIWLNEGFASYCEYLAVEKLPALFPTTNPTAYMQNIHDNVMSQPGGSVFVPLASTFDEGRIFSGRLSYDKGSAIIHTLRFEMQDDTLFFHTLRNYQQQFKDSVATAEDLKQVAETTCSRNFDDFFNQWYYGEGYPTFNIIYSKLGTDTLIMQVNQTVSMPSVTPFFKGLYELKVTSATGDTTVKINQAYNNQQFKFHYTKTPNNIIVDPNNWVLNQTGTILNGVVVPVQLLQFEASIPACAAAILKWKTVSEQNTSKYEIEYSTDSNTFINIGSVNSNRLGESSYQYEYTPTSGSVHFFRIKIINDGGSVSYSQVIRVEKNCAGNNNGFSITISPNPAVSNLGLIISAPAKENISFRIYDAHGALVYRETRSLEQGENRIQLNIQALSHGTYTLRAENASGITNTRFVKLK